MGRKKTALVASLIVLAFAGCSADADRSNEPVAPISTGITNGQTGSFGGSTDDPSPAATDLLSCDNITIDGIDIRCSPHFISSLAGSVGVEDIVDFFSDQSARDIFFSFARAAVASAQGQDSITFLHAEHWGYNKSDNVTVYYVYGSQEDPLRTWYSDFTQGIHPNDPADYPSGWVPVFGGGYVCPATLTSLVEEATAPTDPLPDGHYYVTNPGSCIYEMITIPGHPDRPPTLTIEADIGHNQSLGQWGGIDMGSLGSFAYSCNSTSVAQVSRCDAQTVGQSCSNSSNPCTGTCVAFDWKIDDESGTDYRCDAT